MKFRAYTLGGALVEFRAVWYHSRFGESSTGDRTVYGLDLPITHRKVKRAIGYTLCTLTPIPSHWRLLGRGPTVSPLAQGDAACSASEPGGYSKYKGRAASFGSALKTAGFDREVRTELWKQYWEQQKRTKD